MQPPKQHIMNRFLTPVIHFICCMVFLLAPIYIAPHPSESKSFWDNSFAVKGLFTNLLLVMFFYANFLFFIPKLFYKRRFYVYLLVALISFVIVATIPSLFISTASSYGGHHGSSGGHGGGAYQVSPIKLFLFETRHLLILFFAIFFGSMALSINYKRLQLQVAKEESDLSYLKAQINPHFLFNTLNSIYALSIEKSNKTPEAIVRLSGLMRYLFSDTSLRFASLEKEINYINSYIELQKIRLDNTVAINYSVTGDVSNKQIAPLILIPFIENAFKHGVNPEEPSQIDIQISINESNLYLNVFNLKVDHISDEESKSGYGIDNGKAQLELVYPGKHELKIDNNTHTFSVTLKIELT